MALEGDTNLLFEQPNSTTDEEKSFLRYCNCKKIFFVKKNKKQKQKKNGNITDIVWINNGSGFKLISRKSKFHLKTHSTIESKISHHWKSIPADIQNMLYLWIMDYCTLLKMFTLKDWK